MVLSIGAMDYQIFLRYELSSLLGLTLPSFHFVDTKVAKKH